MHRLPRMLRAVVEGAPQGVIAVDSEGGIRWANSMAEALFGYGTGELAGQPLESLLPEGARARHKDYLRRYFGSPQQRPMGRGLELTGLRKNESVFPVEISLSYVGPPEGPLAIAFVSDISERKRLENERDRFFELSLDPLCIVQRDGSFSQVNPAFAARLGFEPEEMLAKPFGTFIHPDDLEKSRSRLAHLLAGEDLVQFEHRLIAKDGSIRWFQWNAPAPGPTDAVFFAAARDITEAREAAEAQQRLVALIENVGDFVALASTDEPGRILHINRGGRQMLGLPAMDQLRGMTLQDLAIGDPGLREQIEDALARRGHWIGEIKLRHRATGEWIPAELNMFLVLFNGGGSKPIARALVARDIRERKRTQERLHALTGQLLTAQEEERRRIARDLHDDVTQKLAGLAIELGLLRREPLPEALSAHVLRLQEQIAGVAEDLRIIAHDIHPGILEQAGLSAALQAYCADAARQRDVEIRYSARSVPNEIPMDIAVVFYRIAQEAVGNAVKHSGASAIEVALTGIPEAESRLRLTVSDNGKGFVVEQIREGLGLGLLSIEERVQLIRGSFSIRSNPGEGSRLEVEVKLPSLSAAE